jgi:hypothetical protein
MQTWLYLCELDFAHCYCSLHCTNADPYSIHVWMY